MLYCLNPQCSNPVNPAEGKFCVNCGQKLTLGDRYLGVKLIQQGVKGRTILGIDQGSTPEYYCLIKQVIITETVIPQQFLAEFEQNITQLKKLGDRREFPTILDSFIPPSLQNPATPPTVIFEKIEGESLRERLNTSGKFSEAEIRDFLIEILPLVQTIHGHGIVHRDLNPENLIFTSERYWAIVDFTAAKVKLKMANINQGTLVGSGVYTAPEQLRGKTYPASDLYSLGVICLELLTGMHPFDLYSAQSDEWVWRDYLTTPISNTLVNLLNKMVAEKVSDRPPSAAAILETLGIKFQAVKQPIYPPSNSESELPTKKQSITKKIEPEWYCFRTLTGHGSYISDLDFDAQSQFLASAAADQTIRIWDLQNRQEKYCLRGHQSIISRILFWGDRLISGSWDYTVRLWDWHRGEEVGRLEGKQTWIKDLTWFEKTSILVTLGADQSMNLWNLEQLMPVKSWYSCGAELITVDPINEVLMSVNQNKICFWHDEKISTELIESQAKITHFKISKNGKFMISAAEDNTLRIWSMNQQKCDKIFQLANSVAAIAIFPNNRFFTMGDHQGTLHIWQLGQERPSVSLSAHPSEIKAIAISPNSEIIATGAADKTIKLWRFGLQ